SCTTGPSAAGTNPNDYFPCPVIQVATTSVISGTALPNATVEVFTAVATADDAGHGEGKTFLGSATADGTGNWQLAGSFTVNSSVTATASGTGPSGGLSETSEYAANTTVTAG